MPNEHKDLLETKKVESLDIYERLCHCRDFEIKLQWERAVFLTAFLIACFAGYGSFVLSVHQNGVGCLSSLVVKSVPVVLSFIGMVLSLLWIMMSKGSKAWYEFYEKAIEAFARDSITDDKIRYLCAQQWQKMPFINRADMSDSLLLPLKVTQGGAYSVSKIVIMIGWLSLVAWTTLFVLHIAVAIEGPISGWTLSEWMIRWDVWWKLLAIVVVAWVALLGISKSATSGYLRKVKFIIPQAIKVKLAARKSLCEAIKSKGVDKEKYVYARFTRKCVRFYDCKENEIEYKELVELIEDPFCIQLSSFNRNRVIPVKKKADGSFKA